MAQAPLALEESNPVKAQEAGAEEAVVAAQEEARWKRLQCPT